MNIFEDLIEELKEEHLLEETVIEVNKNVARKKSLLDNTNAAELESESDSTKEIAELKANIQDELHADDEKATEEVGFSYANFVDSPSLDDANFRSKPTLTIDPQSDSASQSEFDAFFDELEIEAQLSNICKDDERLPAPEFTLPTETREDLGELRSKSFDLQSSPVHEEGEFELATNTVSIEEVREPANVEIEPPISENVETEPHDVFQRRDAEEIGALQIAEHIVSSIEREILKVTPNQYNDLPVNLALHDYVNFTPDQINSEKYLQTQQIIIQETEKWYSALSERDGKISVGDLRRYCENAKPALSSQALIALARFYRNAPFSEAVRGKFEMVLTRLLSAEKWDDTRELLFTRSEISDKIEQLYKDWSSLPLYEELANEPDIFLAILKFEDFVKEANQASSFEQLIAGDIFNRIKVYKENIGEKFYAPMLAAAAVESNVQIGNIYVELLQIERQIRKPGELEAKYQVLLDQVVSDTTSKTLELIEIIKEKTEPTVQISQVKKSHKSESEVQSKPFEIVFDQKKSNKPTGTPNELQGFKFKVNKLLLAFVAAAFMAFAGLYVWVEYYTPQLKTSASVKKVNLENSSLKQYFKTARISKDVFYAVAEQTWEGLSEDVKKDILKKTLAVGSEKGFHAVRVIDTKGGILADATSKEINISQ